MQHRVEAAADRIEVFFDGVSGHRLNYQRAATLRQHFGGAPDCAHGITHVVKTIKVANHVLFGWGTAMSFCAKLTEKVNPGTAAAFLLGALIVAILVGSRSQSGYRRAWPFCYYGGAFFHSQTT